MQNMNEDNIEAIIENCEQCKGELVYIGEQNWPEQVANAMGIRSVVTLWQCTHCQTTVTISQRNA